MNDSQGLNRQEGVEAETGRSTPEDLPAMTDAGIDARTVLAESPTVRVAADATDRGTAFRSLVGGALDDAYRRATVLLGDRSEAEDAVHDTAEKAWRGWRGLRDLSRFDAWFGRILVNTCRDRLRSRRRVRRIEIRGEPGIEPAAAGAASAAATGGLDQVRDALASLRPDERIAVVLRYEADMTVPAIAALVGVPEGTVKSRLHTALGKLRTILEDEGR